MTKRTWQWPASVVAVTVLLLIIALPTEYKSWAPGFLSSPSFHLGLDLAGGAQLDFRISEEEINQQLADTKKAVEDLQANDASADRISEEQFQLQALQVQKQSIVEAIRTVLERRVNALGVSEAVITPSYIGNEKHLLVECPGDIDPQKCIDTVGKTINLEFKEQNTEPTAEYEQEIRGKVTDAMERIKAGDALQVVGEDFGTQLGINYREGEPYFKTQLPEDLVNAIWYKTEKSGVQQVLASVPTISADADGNQTPGESQGIFLVEVTGPKTQTGQVVEIPADALSLVAKQNNGRFSTVTETTLNNVDQELVTAIQTMPINNFRLAEIDGAQTILFLQNRQLGQELMAASHILIAYQGASKAEADVTRSKAEAQVLATDLKKQLDEGADFNALVAEYSDGPSASKQGSLGSFGRGAMVPAFEAAAWPLATDQVSNPVETDFGFHIIRSDQAPAQEPPTVTYLQARFPGASSAEAEKLVGDLNAGRVTQVAEQLPLRTLFFSFTPTGWKDTSLDGKHFRSATVTLDSTNRPIVQIQFDNEGGKMFRELTARNVGQPLAIFVGGELISAPNVQQEITGGSAVITGDYSFEEARQLAQDLNTGAIPAPIYLAGQRTVEATLGASALQTSLKAAFIGALILIAYMILVYRLLGVLAIVALSTYAVIFTGFLKLPLFLFSNQYIVLTLAGMAGIILSIGMAVDANVLIFERMKEELRKGKLIKTAADTGFKRAWPSIRDGNVSTFITCAVLFTVGTSIVKGFAVTLGMGVLISMFSAIVVTRWIVNKVASQPFAERNRWLFGGRFSYKKV